MQNSGLSSEERLARARAAGVLASLPRRELLAEIDRDASSLKVRRVEISEAPIHRIIARGFAWSWAVTAFNIKQLYDRLRSQASERQKGVRMREMFESLGGTAIKIGQQMAVRVDFLPFETCEELGKLMDAVPPFPLSDAIPAIERACGRPVDEVYEHIEQEPIGSASIACVFRGQTHDGREVAIKVRRPDVGKHFTADLRVVSGLTQLIEMLTLVPPGFFQYLRSELRDMFMDELDFHKEGNFQTMFRRYVKRDRLKWLNAPRVYADLSNPEVLASELIRALPCQELLTAVETGNTTALRAFKELGVDPRKVGDRVMELSHWSRLECPFFHADPHPGNILILPGSKLMILDFGACGIMSGKQSEHYRELGRRILRSDISGAASVMLSSLSPLPHLDVNALRKRLEKLLFDSHITAKSKDGEWWERTSAALYIAMLEGTKEFNMPLNLDVLRITRALLLYDTLACRLNPSIDADSGFRKWRKRATKRARRRGRRERRRQGDARLLIMAQLGSLSETAAKAMFWMGTVSRELPKQFTAMSGKGAYVAALLLRVALVTALLLVVMGSGLIVYAWWTEGTLVLSRPRQAVTEALGHPAFWVVLLLLGFTLSRRTRQRLDVLDPDDD